MGCGGPRVGLNEAVILAERGTLVRGGGAGGSPGRTQHPVHQVLFPTVGSEHRGTSQGTRGHPPGDPGPVFPLPHPANPRSQAATSPPTSEVGGNAGAWLGRPLEAPVTDHCPQPQDYRAQIEASPPGPACRPALEPGQPPFLAQPRRQGRQAAPRSYRWRTGVKSASTFPSGRHKGQGPSGTGGGLSRREGGSARPESLGWAPRPSLQGVLACSADNIPPGACLE